ncbi:Ig-like domain-containing protein [Moritella sp. PE36]|uniref:beta strand repeat-containing protein n=1 Tax=Moritella sp. PE36 TaxID=58051 RepID=UPI0012F7A209|nr:Ig-like domain-containing protein [Moritella sp. PE36]
MNSILKNWLFVLLSFALFGCNDPNGSTMKRVIYVDENSQVELTSAYVATSNTDHIEWRQISGKSIELSDVNSSTLVFFSPTTETKLTLEFESTVLSSVGNMVTEIVTVVVVPYITGLVIDDPLIGATVRLLSFDSSTEHASTITDENGRYRFSNTLNLNRYKLVVDAQTGFMSDGSVFEAEMKAVCINSTERHDCNITPISTFIAHHLEQTADMESKEEAVVQIELAWNIDLSLDPFVHEIPEINTGSTFKADDIRIFLDNGRQISTWLDNMSAHVTQIIEQEEILPAEQDDINSWIDFKREAGIPLIAGPTVNKSVGDMGYRQEATAGNGGAITYTSSDHAVAMVDSSGNVTVLDAGTATITAIEAQSMKYLSQNDAYTLIVARGDGTLLSAGTDISKTTDDGSFTQVASGGNGGAITYASSDTAVATVNDSGVVTLVGAGETTVTASEAQTASYLTQNDAYTLTVTRGDGTLLRAGTDISKTTDDGSFTQAASGGNGGAITYASSDTAVATVNDIGVVTLVGAGETTVTASEAQTVNYLTQSDAYTLTVARGDGTGLNAGVDMNKTTDDASFTQAASGGNGGAITYASSDMAVAMVNDTGVVTLVSAGETSITASEAQTANYQTQNDAYTLTVTRGDGSLLSAGTDISKTTDDGSFTQAASGGNGGAITYASSDTAVATVNDTGVVTLVGAGETTVTASEAQTANYLTQNDAYTLTVVRGDGTGLNAGVDMNKTTDDASFTQAASGGNGGAITYASSDTAVATVNDSGVVTLVGAGETTVTASEAQTASYLTQNDAYTLTVTRGDGTLLRAGTDISKTTDDGSFTQAASGGNGGAITYASSDMAVAMVNDTGVVTLVSAGETSITASEAQTANYQTQNDAYTLTVTRGDGSLLSAGTDISKTTDDGSFTQAASGGNGGAITYASSDTAVATVNDIGVVTLVGAGETTVTASEAQTANYQTQHDAYTLTVTRGDGSLLSAGTDISKTTDDASFTQAASGGNGGAVTYASSDTAVATVNDTGVVTLVGAGETTVTASEAQTVNYLTQNDAYTLIVARGDGTLLSAGTDISKTTDDASFTQVASGGNGGAITYASSDTAVATVNDIGVVTLVGAGETTVTASEAQTVNYLTQNDAYTLTVARGDGTGLNAGVDMNKTTDDGSFTQAASGGNGGAITYASSDMAVATVNDIGVVTLVGAGETTVTASEAQTASYLTQHDAYTLTVVRGDGSLLSAGTDISKTTDDGSFTQAASGGNGGAITYASSDTAVATVNDSGVVTLVGAGETTVTASEAQTVNYLTQNDAYTLIVARGDGTLLSAGTDISKTTDDASFTQVASGGNGGAITYASSDTAVATVNDIGVVTLVSAGETTVTASEAQTANYLTQNDAYTLIVTQASQRVESINSNLFAFAALHSDGSVTTWGSSSNGGDSTSVSDKLDGSKPVVKVDSNRFAFAALHSDGSVTTWGGGSFGGDSSSVSDKLDGSKQVVKVDSNFFAFAALYSDGSVITWGNGSHGGDSSSVSDKLDGSKPVVKVDSTTFAFAALHSDGSVTTWGNGAYGGDSTSVSDKLDGSKPVVKVDSTEGGFAALYSDGSVTTWGGALTVAIARV